MIPLSRRYLQQLAEIKRQEKKEKEFKDDINRLVQLMYNPVIAAAELGETKYFFVMRVWTQEQRQRQQEREKEEYYRHMQQLSLLGRNPPLITAVPARKRVEPPPEISGDELTPSEGHLTGIREKFPGCTVSVLEDWVETPQGVRELKKGILIDWS